MNKKLKVIGSGNKEGRFFFIFNKEESFFGLFSSFLINCGFRNLGIYEYYQEEKPDIKLFNNKVENFKNEEYDIDIIYTNNSIILIIRTNQENYKSLMSGIEKIADFN